MHLCCNALINKYVAYSTRLYPVLSGYAQETPGAV